MATQDTCCTIVPYFDVPESYMATFKTECVKFVELMRKESGCLFYGVTFNGNTAHCREGYVDGDAALAPFAPQFFVLELGFRR